ncbi:MAG: HAMP domain-containing sensor histidine kinase [Anaerolineales bacterium]
MLTQIRSRLVLTHLLVTGLVLTLLAAGLLFFLSRNSFAERQIYRQLENIATLVGTRDAGALVDARLRRFVAAIGRAEALLALDGRVLVLDPRGNILADSRADLPAPPAEALQTALESETQGEFGVGPNRWLFVTRPFEGRSTLLVAAPQPTLRTITGLARDFVVPILQTCLVGLAVSVALAWLTARWVAGPLRRMAQAAEQVAGGDLSTRLEPEGPEEVQRLAGTFNQMVERVQASAQAQRDFVANVSHELKTPLTSIQGFAQAIQEGAVHDAQELRHAARVIHEESDRLRRLVEDLLDLARLDAHQVSFARVPLDLNALMVSVAERISFRAAEKGVRVENELPAFPPMVGDGDRLAQVFTNLLDNAVKFTPAGGCVRLRGEFEDGWASVHVEDMGPGIPADELSRIFERFYQLDKARRRGGGGGAGLGLAISREIVQGHGGQLRASSRPGEGSRFSVRLPITRPRDPMLTGKRRARIR